MHMEIKITSPAFPDGGEIPTQYTCDGQDHSPPLKWDAVPSGTQTIALICEDPDAPIGTFVHWVLYNLPGELHELPEGLRGQATLPDGSQQGISDFGRTGYGGPCPPNGTHRYYFKIYALDARMTPGHDPGKADLVQAMKGHILGEGQIMGKYRRR